MHAVEGHQNAGCCRAARAVKQPQGRRAGQLASAWLAAAALAVAVARRSVREHAAAPSSHGQQLVLPARWLARQACILAG